MLEYQLVTILPAALVVLAFIYDSVSLIHQPKFLKSTLHCLSAPFTNFLTQDDLGDLKPTPAPVSTLKCRALSLLAFLEAAVWLSALVYACITNDTLYGLEVLLDAITWLYISLRITLRPPRTVPYVPVIFAALHGLISFMKFVYYAVNGLRKDAGLQLLQIIIPAIFTGIAGSLPIQAARVSPTVAHPTDAPSVHLSCPEDDVTLWSWSTFSFVEPIFGVATKRTLNDTDVWSLSPFFLHRNLFKKRLEYQARHPGHSLLRFLLASNSLDLILDVMLKLWIAVGSFVPSYALMQILSLLGDDQPASTGKAYYWALVTFFFHLSFAQVDLFQSWHSRRCYERTRGQLFCAIHYKALKRQDVTAKVEHKDKEAESANLGKIVNLMQGDVYAVAQRFWEFSALFTSPIRLIVALVFLYNILGWSCLYGVGLVLIAYILNYPLAKYNISITRSSWKAKDTRMNVVNELLQNIRFLKFYGWEYYWAGKSQDAREKELQWRVKENVIDTLVSFIWTSLPSLTALTVFMSYTLIAGERLTVSKVFTSVALFTQLQGPMTELPGQIFAMLHAYVSMQRIEKYLEEEEVPAWASSLTALPAEIDEKKVGFSAASFQWQSLAETGSLANRFQLGPLSFVFPEGELSLVTGATGSGKTTLLAALLGEIHCLSGNVYMDKTNHKVAYCAQNPWLEHNTIRENIIFGSPYGYDEARYHRVIEACALTRDLGVLDAGDMTEIGEKGITLSGGQRARIALARALYSQAQYILLDDPLAAVDMHTAQHIVDHCLSGELVRKRTVILVTHHIRLCLPVAAYLVELSHGLVLRNGSIASLRETGLLEKAIEAEDVAFLPETEVEVATGPANEADRLASLRSRPIGNGKLVEAEARAEGRVTLRTYLTYIRAAGAVCWIGTVLLMVFIRLVNIVAQVFLAAWSGAYEDYPPILMITTIKYPWEGLPPPDSDVRPWLTIYLFISLVGASSVMLYIALGYYASLQASRSLFIALLNRLTRAPARFFDVTPIGRILNRFTTDMNTIDGALQNSARNCLLGFLNFIASFLVILYVIPAFAPVAIFISWLYVRLAPPYIQASRDLRRLESISLSPAFVGFDELLRGITHVRAFAMENRYQDAFYAKVDKFQAFDHVYWLVNGWLRWRYDCLGSVVVFATTLFALWMGVPNGATAIAIVQAGIFADASRQLVRVAAQLELDFNSVERVVEYLDVPQEAPAIIENSRPPAYWPSNSGGLVVNNLTVTYAKTLPPVLKNLSFTVRPSEKIGIVGRTGSGKSTLALSLLRMIEVVDGAIIIDGIDISTIGLEDLRTRLTIVSQDVSLFSGTIRSNLDPMSEHTTEECLDVLDRCHLISALKHDASVDDTVILNMPISQGSLSGGQRQLVALARAVLRKTNIIIMDEATSQIDSATDDQIQKTIREELSSAIVLTIAHRLKTIIDYDRVLVLDNGEIAEFGTPKELLSKATGPFKEMCKRSTDWPLFRRVIN